MAERHGAATETEVRGADWYGEDLSGQEHTRVAFSGVDLSETTDDGAVFTECTFRDCRFNLSRHTEAAFLNCTFTGCSFFQAEFTDCKVTGSTFERCTFDLMAVVRGDWSFVGLPGADLRRASLHRDAAARGRPDRRPGVGGDPAAPRPLRRRAARGRSRRRRPARLGPVARSTRGRSSSPARRSTSPRPSSW